MDTIVIIIFICGWLSTTFIAGCIMEAAVAKFNKIKAKLSAKNAR